MATVPYGEGVATVAPDDRTPDDYQRIQTNPGQFGGLIAQGAEQLGAGASHAAQFFGQAAADDASNNYQDAVTKILHGDPNKTVPGPDGKPTQDTGYLGLQGAAALNARPGVEKRLDDLQTSIRAGLTTPEQQLQFDNFTRRYRSYASGQIGTFADAQSKQWAGAVNQDTASLAINHIGANPDDPAQVAAGASDLIHARVKDAQLHGAVEGDPVYNAAVASGKRDALKAQVQAIGVKDPARAMSILDKNRDIAGADYGPLAESFRARSDQQSGIAAGATAVATAHNSVMSQGGNGPAAPLFHSLESDHGLPPGFLGRTMQIESGGKDVTNPNSAAAGKFQFIPSTAARLGVDPHDFRSSADGAARLAEQNSQTLRLGLGRDPSGAELYLAHQQGGMGAVKLLTHPNDPAASIVGLKAVLQNGGRQDMTAAQFANLWISKYNGTTPNTNPTPDQIVHGGVSTEPPPEAPQTVVIDNTQPAAPSEMPAPSTAGTAAPAAPTGAPPPSQDNNQGYYPSVKADAYQQILAQEQAGSLSPEAAQHALQFVNQTLQIQQVAEAEQEKAKQQANDKAANGYVSQMLTGQGGTDMVQRIAQDPALKWETRRALGDAALKSAKGDVNQAAQAYGPGFWGAYKAVTAPVGDPSRISDPTALLRRAGPGGDLTLEGVQKLSQVLGQNQRSVDDQAVNTTKVGLMNYAKSQLSFEQDTQIPGMPPIKDPKGEAIFASQFIPKFEASYDQWIKDGKDPWQFLTKDNTDKLISGMRPKSQMAMDQVAATADANGGVMPTQVPPAPKAANPQAWNAFMLSPPKTVDGKPFPAQVWAGAINLLLSNPTPENIQKWDQSKFGQGGYLAEDILAQLHGQPAAPQPAAVQPSAPAQPTQGLHPSAGHALPPQPAQPSSSGLHPSAGHALPPQPTFISPFSPKRTGH